ncbi:MAG: nucleoside triphosphate pyrophosphohydrolase [Wenzhouxiangella sp.]|nr:nucleoside triphosphate pyrophosphohydrolase [Wenzhouxiangella sp.]MDR9453670.1 nucleoside triphosphate pyrophosphohydrolase [Wenzhouxiangella sp.]
MSTPSVDVGRIDRLLAIMAALRDPLAGCPWDLAQDFRSIAPCTIEEAHEVADAIERADFDELPDEVGDLLFQVVFYARLGQERGAFDFAEVVERIIDKLERRHPHIFSDTTATDPEAVAANWERIKAKERADKGDTDNSLLAGVSTGLPAFTRCLKLQKRAARVGFEWPDMPSVLVKLDEEVAELKEAIDSGAVDAIEDELGDALLVLTNVARRMDLDPDLALRRANRKFETRFRAMEEVAKARGQSLDELDLDAKEALWQTVKKNLKD